MSALKLGCEGLGPAEMSGVVYPWLSQSTVTQTLTPGGGLVTPSRSGFHPLLDLFPVVSCVIVSSPLGPTQGLHRAGAGTPMDLS